MPKPRLDMRRLRKDVAVAPSRIKALAPGGRLATGLMDAIRQNLDAIVQLKADGNNWKMIAEGLNAQGFRTADGREITSKNLTGIISSVRRQAKRRADIAAQRARRPDLFREAQFEPTPRDLASEKVGVPRQTEKFVRHRLAPELRDVREEATGETGPIGEDEIRRLQAEKLKHLLKGI